MFRHTWPHPVQIERSGRIFVRQCPQHAGVGMSSLRSKRRIAMSKTRITIANGRKVKAGSIVWIWRSQTLIPKLLVAQSNHEDFVKCVHLDNQGRPYEEKKTRVFASPGEAKRSCPWNEGLAPHVMFRIGKILGKASQSGQSVKKTVPQIQITRRSPDLIKLAKKARKN